MFELNIVESRSSNTWAKIWDKHSPLGDSMAAVAMVQNDGQKSSEPKLRALFRRLERANFFPHHQSTIKWSKTYYPNDINSSLTMIHYMFHTAQIMREGYDRLLHPAAHLCDFRFLGGSSLSPLRSDQDGGMFLMCSAKSTLRGQGAIGHAITRQTHKKSIKHCRRRAVLSSTW